MKKIFFLYIITSTHIFFAMEDQPQDSYFNRFTKTLYDKWDPTLIIIELNKSGASKDDREKMTQEHRLDRVIPYYIENKETAKLCTVLKQISANKWPLSNIAKNLAMDYLWTNRPAVFKKDKDMPLLNEINATMDILAPAQIIYDIEQGQLYYETKADVEYRISGAFDKLMELKRTDDLKKLMIIITPPEESTITKEEITIKKESFSFVPGERILKAIYQYFRLQEKEGKKYKDRWLDSFKNIKKNDSDNEVEQKEPEKQ